MWEILDEVTRRGFTKGDFEETREGRGKTSHVETWTSQPREEPWKSSRGRRVPVKSGAVRRPAWPERNAEEAGESRDHRKAWCLGSQGCCWLCLRRSGDAATEPRQSDGRIPATL